MVSCSAHSVQFDDLIDSKYQGLTFYPDNLKKEIDELNEWCGLPLSAHVPLFTRAGRVYDTVNK